VRLGVNIDHIATLRQARRAKEPDPVQAAVLAELAGAHSITVHLRSDRRHIQDRDVQVLRQVVKTRLNLELAATAEMLALAVSWKPDQVTLVPERPQEITTEGGLDVVSGAGALLPVVKSLKAAGIQVSLFIDPAQPQVRKAQEMGADAIEINTAAWSEAYAGAGRADALRAVSDTAAESQKLGLTVHAGHGLNYENVRPIAGIPGMVELNIGHSIVARASLVGFERAVREMLQAMSLRGAP
jgi:pyridoxine 5-phosphate synthase